MSDPVIATAKAWALLAIIYYLWCLFLRYTLAPKRSKVPEAKVAALIRAARPFVWARRYTGDLTEQIEVRVSVAEMYALYDALEACDSTYVEKEKVL